MPTIDAAPPGVRRVLILGGGFGGVYTAMHLLKGMSREEREKTQVALVSRENYIVFQPMLPEVISGEVEMTHVVSPIRRLAKGCRLYTRPIEDIDLESRTVTLAHDFQARRLVLPYDHLVIAMGNTLRYELVPGLREHALPFKYLDDALRLRNHLVHVLEEASITFDRAERERLLTFVVAGGGYSGVECIAMLNDFLERAILNYPTIDEGDLRVILLQGADRILPELGEGLAGYADRLLRKRGVELKLGVRLHAVTPTEAVCVSFATKEEFRIPTRTTVSTVPAGQHPLLTRLGLSGTRGRIQVDGHLAVPDHPGVWALGDTAAVPQKDGSLSPPTAQHATREAKTCAHNILAELRGTPDKKKTFDFKGLGSLASLGRRSAVAEVMGFRFSGWIAWWLWRTIYLMKLPGLDRKIRVALDWTADLFLPRDITELRLFRPDSVQLEHFEPGQTIFDQGDYGDRVYFVRDGDLEVVRDGEVIAKLGKGDTFGEIALLRDEPRSAAVRAVGTADLVSVSRRAFGELLMHVPGVRQSMEAVMRAHVDPNIDWHDIVAPVKSEGRPSDVETDASHPGATSPAHGAVDA